METHQGVVHHQERRGCARGLVKGIPAIARPAIKGFYKGPVLAAAKGLPFVGKYLLQRNVIKVGIPLVGVPTAVVVNRYSTQVAGRHAQSVFRNDARVMQVAEILSQRSQHPRLLLWVAWLVIMADNEISDDEANLMRHLASLIREQHKLVDEDLARLVQIDPSEVWRRLDAETGGLGDILDAAKLVAGIDGTLNAAESTLIAELADRCELA